MQGSEIRGQRAAICDLPEFRALIDTWTPQTSLTPDPYSLSLNAFSIPASTKGLMMA